MSMRSEVECLAELERLSEQERIDLFYGDESGVSLLPCVPYAWQFADEQVAMPAAKGGNVNCFALLTRRSRCLARDHAGDDHRPVRGRAVGPPLAQPVARRRWWCWTTRRSITAGRSAEWRDAWQERGLFVFYLPPYSPAAEHRRGAVAQAQVRVAAP